jgi:NADH-quinone oxidoreductase subunit L
MVMAVGLSGPAPAMFHLTTHAFFKALLFLGAGSVIHSLQHEQNIWNMGGLRNKMPLTFATFLVGTLALAGVPPFSGFYSKDAILAAAWHANLGLFLLGVLVAALTTFYMLRLLLVAFLGSNRSEAAKHAHESPGVMTTPLLILAVPALLAGLWGIEAFYTHQFQGAEPMPAGTWLQQIIVPFSHAPLVALASLGAVVVGALAAWPLYSGSQTDPLPQRLGALAQAMRNRFYFDELYQRLVDSTQDALATAADAFDRWIIDGLFIGGLRGTTDFVGRLLRLLQTGNLQTYAFSFVIGVALLLFYMLK